MTVEDKNKFFSFRIGLYNPTYLLVTTMLTLLGLHYMPAYADISVAREEVQTRLDETYAKLITNSEFERAFAYIEDAVDRETKLFVGYHLLFGTGVTQDTCRAVRIFEDLHRPDLGFDRALSSLNLIYGGNWAGIGAIEGSHAAALQTALYYMNIPQPNRLGIINKNSFFDRKAIGYFKLAIELGSGEAMSYLTELAKRKPELVKSTNAIKLEKKSIICPIRVR